MSELILNLNGPNDAKRKSLRRHTLERFNPRQRERVFPLASVSRPAVRPTQPPIPWVPGSFPDHSRTARPGRDADPSPKSSAEVKNE
jgi:hypothetical protein